jgi:hypothetical protein
MRQLMFALVGVLLLQACEEDDATIRTDSSMSPAQGDSAVARDASVARDGSMAADAARPLDGGPSNLNRSGLNNVGVDADLDYSKRELWVCRPGNQPNECHTDLTATEFLKDGGRRIIEHERNPNPEFDCFYVYPTVDLSGGGNMTDFTDKGVALVLDPLRSQAARFTRLCEVYAPLYRQISLASAPDAAAGTVMATGNPTRAVTDVEQAFDYYMKNFNKGRKFVVMGHSQGTSMVTSLLARVIDPNEQLRSQMISAVILGGGPTTPPEQDVGGSFKNIKKCTEPGQVGCVLAYVSYAAEAPPATTMGRFGKDTTTDAGVRQVICTEPSALANNVGKNYRGSYFRLQTNNASFMSEEPPPVGVTTPFVLYRDYFKGECVREDPYSYLKINMNPSADDKRPKPSYRSARLEPTGWGLHLMDYNLELDDLIDAVELQAAAAN